ncbi:MauE/DoxX family redox-associated membrane protein [Chryseobacterium sp. FH1]|uniref:MauE/DoxX family redox-associated membrane protein n=1 Tax=Chryseobacterium sp. FH1 TaxID=1233951 RepID=UPI0004E30F5E|nr:MauE/DoxX family redox-associated membrane protein [Chryseobacterium sp. FH1]KFC19702.1 hypothetical protein IO90_10575 [Chryseobacterium sp. FH1]
MKAFKTKFVLLTGFFFILLFCYTAISKMFDFENFQVQLAQSPLTNAYSISISYTVILVELIIVCLLCVPRLRLIGLHASFTLMSLFTIYIYIILNYSDNIPCSCGGVLEKLGWSEHLIFNLVCAAIALIAIVISTENKRKILLAVMPAEMIIPSVLLTMTFYPVIKQNQDSFVRKIIDPFTSELKMIDLEKSNHYFAGNYNDTIFLADSKTPLLLRTVDPKFDKIKTDKIRLDDYSLKFRSVRINVLYPYFSLSDGKVPVIFEGELPSMDANKTAVRNLYFSKLSPTGQHQYVFRAFVTETKKSELGVLNTVENRYTLKPKVIKSDVDGIFDVDGNLWVDMENRRILYTYLYRNEIVSADFDLDNLEMFNTIDSFSRSDIKVKELSNGQTKMMRSPQEINVRQTVFAGRLYNISKIRGKDESFRDFRKSIVIDIYDLKKKKYLYSYKLKNEDRSSVKGILRTKKYFYVLSSERITRYAFK